MSSVVLLLGAVGVAAAVRGSGAPQNTVETESSAGARTRIPVSAPLPVDSALAFSDDVSAVARKPITSKMVALSFDDGPSRNTAEVVEILRTHEASATFFFVGSRMTKGAFEPQSLLAVGEIGNHTWNHAKRPPWNLYTYKQAKSEIEDTNRRILDKSGTEARLFRSVGLKRNPAVDRAVKDTGMTSVDGVLVDDWGTGPGNTAAGIKERVSIRAPSDRTVLILHETNDATVEALPGILDWYESRGFQVVTVSQLLASE